MSGILGDGPNIFTIPAERPFIPSLAEGLKALAQERGLEAPDLLVFMPNVRSIRAYQMHEMDRQEGAPILLPDLRALGQLDPDDILLGGLLAGAADLDLPPAITSFHRQFLLSKELERFSGSRLLGDLSARQRFDLAGDLGRLLDQMQNSGLDAGALQTLVPKDLSKHWETILAFLGVILRDWPKKLEALGLMDPVQRRTKLVEHQIAAWKENPPGTPVIAAGSTGSIPVTRTLLKAIAGLKEGIMILPGFDLELETRDWEALTETHPQFMMRLTLKDIGIARDLVRPWPFGPKANSGAATRVPFFKAALKPAETTDDWVTTTVDQKTVMKSFDVLEAENIREEATAIALILREALETPNKKAALITPDRALAERVRAELQRWNLDVDDSAGQKLLKTPPGAFFMGLAEMVEEKFTALSVLALLKNPLVTLGLARQDLLGLVRDLDKLAFRGPGVGAGFGALKAAVKSSRVKDKKPHLELLGKLEKETAALVSALGSPSVKFIDILKAHIGAARALSGSEKDQALWAGTGGETLAAFLTSLETEGEKPGAIKGADYPGILKALLEKATVRLPFGSHPRLSILGAIEGRMQTPDLVVLGSLNEGSWPGAPAADPWMSQDMRKAIGLPTPEERIGQSAHDFFMALGANEVILTRSKKQEDTPATPSRWLQRAEALLGGQLPGTGKPWLAWARVLDRPESTFDLAPPEPRPPANKRPVKLSVTNIEKLIHDPYAIYAKYVLELEPLEDLGADPGAADKGMILHKIFEVFFTENKNRLPDNALDKLVETGKRVFEEAGYTRPAIRAFWWPRFLEVAGAFITEQTRREETFSTFGVELRGALSLKTKTPFTLTAKADRIDLDGAGNAWIIDYKSGGLPTGASLKTGDKPQLPLEGVMALEGGFEGLEVKGISGLEFWNIGKPGASLDLQPISKDLDEIIENAREGLLKLVEHFSDPANPYLAVPDPSSQRYGDYDPLSRYREWQNRPAKEDGS